jgi:hypothetical protein
MLILTVSILNQYCIHTLRAKDECFIYALTAKDEYLIYSLTQILQ